MRIGSSNKCFKIDLERLAFLCLLWSTKPSVSARRSIPSLFLEQVSISVTRSYNVIGCAPGTAKPAAVLTCIVTNDLKTYDLVVCLSESLCRRLPKSADSRTARQNRDTERASTLFPNIQPSDHSVDRPIKGRVNLGLCNFIEMSLFHFCLLR